MNDSQWMIYGAYGYTGKLLVEEAVKRGHKPILAGRSADKLHPVAQQYDLPSIAFDLNATAPLDALKKHNIKLVMHAAGPFMITAQPMRDACLQAGAHYLDITGEVSVYEDSFALHDQAVEKGVLIMSGAGFDIVPSDCLIAYVAGQLPDAKTLTVVIAALGASDGELGVSTGTLRSLIEMLPKGILARRKGQLIPIDPQVATFDMPQGKRDAVTAPWGDVATGYRTSGIPNITAYLVIPRSQIRAMRLGGNLLKYALRIDPLRQWVSNRIDVPGPSEKLRQTGRSHVYVRAENSQGDVREAWLDTVEAYRFTAEAGVRLVEKVLAENPAGALTPAQVAGADFVLEIPTTKRADNLADL